MATILVVEDHELSREALARCLQRKGYSVVTANDGELAVALARSVAPNLILMDLGLPKLDGWTATRRLKADAATQHIPIIIVSAHPMAEGGAALSAGEDAVDMKPVQFKQLISKIEGLLRPFRERSSTS